MATFFSDFFSIDPTVIEKYGAFDISLVNDLPLFIDPFLLFNSKKPEYRALHDEIINYLVFLRGKAAAGEITPALLKAWYCFPEIKQTWLGFSVVGNDGRGLGMDFARTLHSSLHDLFPEFGKEKITRGSHLEKLCLIKDGVGRDNISDFTTNLIKAHLYGFTQRFALEHLQDDQRREVAVRGVRFNYETESWETATFVLPFIDGDHVVLTPKDLLTRDENWINRPDLIRDFDSLPYAIPDGPLREQVSNYFHRMLLKHADEEATQKERAAAAVSTIAAFPRVIDYYIRFKEERGQEAEEVSASKVRSTYQLFNAQIRTLQLLLLQAGRFYGAPLDTHAESHERLNYLKDVIENKGGHRLFYVGGKPLKHESELQIAFRLVWFGSPSDVSREVNDGRGPADFKVARGAMDKTIIEIKLARNKTLKRNLLKQAEIYQAASDAKHAIKVIMFFTENEHERVLKILKELKLLGHPDIVLIDARNDNKPSGSKAA